MADNKTEKPTVATPSKLYEGMVPDWELVDALHGGTRTMRAAGATYLPMEPGESSSVYTTRLRRTFLFPGLKRSIQALTGKVFSKPIGIHEEAPQEVSDWSHDIDLMGRTLESFGQEVFELGLRKGLVHLHIDFPRIHDADGMTLEEERAAGARPYLRMIDPSDVIFWWSEQVSGAERLLEVRIKEKVRERDGEYGEKYVDQIRVLTPGAFQTYRKKNEDSNSDWIPYDEGLVSYPDEIPWTTIYFGREGFMRAKPPLLELANLNIAHWQSSSDQRNILRVARVPFIFGAGLTKEEVEGSQGKFELGSNKAIIASDPEASMQFVEHSGDAIESGKQDLDDLKTDMAALGFELLVKRPGNETATARAIDTSEMNSVLQSYAIELQGGLTRALSIALVWINKEHNKDKDLVLVNTDFGLTDQGQAELDTLLKSRLAGDVSRETFWSELKRRGILADDFDDELEQERLGSEMSPPVAVEDDDNDDGTGGEEG